MPRQLSVAGQNTVERVNHRELGRAYWSRWGTAVEYRFKASEWSQLAASERIHRCKLMAQEAQELAKSASASMKDHYLMLAKNWLDLAAEVERTMNIRSQL